MQPDGTGSAGAGANARPPPVTAAPAPSGRPVSVLPHKTANVRDHYRIGKKLGQGQFGTTYLCVAKEDGAEFACKSIPKRKLLCREDYEDAWREIQIMHHLSEHPNVVRIRAAYEDALFVHIVMELCAGGKLFDRIVAKGHYTERAAAQLIRTIVGVVEGCHSLGVMHRDLKPENFLFASTAEDAPLKTTDFGLSMFYKPGDKFSDVVGSPYYVAPEVLQKCYGPEADVWSAGVILYILLCGVPPFWAETEAGIFRQILRGKLDFESEPWPSISDSAKDLVRNMLCRDPTKRLSAHEVLCHPWIVDDAVAPDKPIDSAVLSRLKHFSAMNKLKKMALRVIAESLSEEEIGGLNELFKMIDADNSGTITFDELKDGLKRVGSELTEHEIQALMDAADIDNSGTIDYGEFIAATLHMNKLEREENLVSAFEFFDKDGSGFITIDELSQACSQFGLDVHLEDMIKDVDQNNDGQIDYSEFAAMMRKGNAGAAGRRTMRNSLQLNLGDSLCRSNPVRCPAPPKGFSTSLVPIPSCISSSKAIFMELSPISASLGAMGSLPGKLGELLATRHWALRGVVMDEIEQLTNDLHTLQNFLVKLSNAQDPPMTARYWMKNVRELTYDMVDCVDQFVHADARAKICRATRRKVIARLKINRLPERWKWRPWITNKISEFRTRAQEATQRYWRYRFDACVCNPGYSRIGQDLPNIVPDPDDLVGIEGPMNQLEQWLTSGDEQLKVVSIVGVAGIGKTTLAQKMWGKLHGQFECRAFVRAAQKPDMRGVIRSILSQVRRHQPPGPGDMHHLICDLREYLQDKR
ncbi:calcium-dependent protein kinase 24-like isoform X4 [Lolium rigidum]|nr:calcium-dependent protein kinase 24-like isoform X4 [Lolium rigidum]